MDDEKRQVNLTKYHVPSKGLMENNSWRLYKDGFINDTDYTDHVDIRVPSWTVEGNHKYKTGFSMASGPSRLIWKKDPVTKKRYGVLEPIPDKERIREILSSGEPDYMVPEDFDNFINDIRKAMGYLYREDVQEEVFAPDHRLVKGLSVVSFTSVTCPPCKRLKPVLEQLKNKFDKFTFINYDVNEDPAVARQHNVKGIPAVFVMDGSKVLESFTGFKSEEEIGNLLEKL